MGRTKKDSFCISDLITKPLGFGTMRLPVLDGKKSQVNKQTVCEMVDCYINRGCNYFETAFNYHGGAAENTIKECVTKRYPRESFILADKLPVSLINKSADMEKIFKLQLERCGVATFDVYLLHNIGRSVLKTIEEVDAFSFLTNLKEDGYVRFIGFSFHDSAEVLEEILSKHHEQIDVVQLQINYFDWESCAIQSKKCYQVARKYNLPIIVMEPIKGGMLLDVSDETIKQKLASVEQTMASLALRFSMSLEGVICVLSGMGSVSQVKDNAAAASNTSPLNRIELEAIEEVVEELQKERKIQCTSCGYCVDVCPQHIPIPEILNLYNFGTQGGSGGMYNRICRPGHRASDCTQCGACEKICSQRLPIREHLKESAVYFEREKTIVGKIKGSLSKTKIYPVFKRVYHKMRPRY